MPSIEVKGWASLRAFAARRTTSLCASSRSRALRKAIDEALFVMPNPVGFHLGNVYDKLRIEGRVQLPGALKGHR